jgi:hypothetical protein
MDRPHNVPHARPKTVGLAGHGNVKTPADLSEGAQSPADLAATIADMSAICAVASVTAK